VPEHIHRACFFTGAWCKVIPAMKTNLRGCAAHGYLPA
jgi:hypothetical protein